MPEIPQFPGNSKQPKKAEPVQERPQPVASGKGVAKKKSIGKQFTETFIGGDLKTTARYVVVDVAIPAFRDLVADSAIQGVERLIFGEARRNRRPMMPGGMRPGPTPGSIQYQNMNSTASPARQAMAPRQRSRPEPNVNDFMDVVLENRAVAETVLERMGDVLQAHGRVRVSDFYSLVRMPTTHTDDLWGWTDLRGSHVTRNHDGSYLLTLPDPDGFNDR